MTQRGRTSAAALASVVLQPRARPEPPEALTEPQQAVWRAVVGAKPVDWFDAGNFPLLVAYCRAAVDAEVIALQIARMGGFDATDRASLARYAKLLRLQDANAGTLARLATKMRCTQQSKMRPDSAAARAAGAPGPWERGKQ